MKINRQVYHEHEQIAVIDRCLEQAMAGQSQIPSYALSIWGMSGQRYRMFINNYMRTLENPSYLEIGSYTGSTLCAAVGGIDNVRSLAVDDFSYGGASKEVCEENLSKVIGQNSDIKVVNQRFEDFDYSVHGKFKVYMYDAEHTEQDQRDAIIRAVPALEPISLIIVDDWNDHGYTTPVKLGTWAGFARTNLEILYKWEIETGQNGPVGSDWHNGYGIFLVRNPN